MLPYRNHLACFKRKKDSVRRALKSLDLFWPNPTIITINKYCTDLTIFYYGRSRQTLLPLRCIMQVHTISKTYVS